MGDWPGLITAPCADCGCPGHHHQPTCVNVVDRNGRAEYCGCPAYRALDRREAHRRGLCVDCKRARHSPGRPRCEDCHTVYMQPPAPPPFVIELTLLPDPNEAAAHGS